MENTLNKPEFHRFLRKEPVIFEGKSESSVPNCEDQPLGRLLTIPHCVENVGAATRVLQYVRPSLITPNLHVCGYVHPRHARVHA
jgi:hypothetical protein